MQKHPWRVTEKAGSRVNGQRVVVGQTLHLTDAEARYHEDLGEIERATHVASEPAEKPAKR